MDVDNSKIANGTNIRLCAYNNANAQQFGFVKVSNGAYRIVTKITSGQKGVSVESSSTADGGNIHQWAYSGVANDHWFLEKVENPGYKGFAVYRDGALLGLNWHAALLGEARSTDYLPVIHITDLFGPVKWDSWSNFIDGNNYKGVYRPKQTITDAERGLVVGMGKRLMTESIGWTAIGQMDINESVWINQDWVYPEDINTIRCDGVVEYCYEYYGIRIYGNDTAWDISKATFENITHHQLAQVTPKSQAEQWMTKVSSTLPTY